MTENIGWHWWVDPQDGRVYRKRDANDFISAAGSRDEDYYGNSPLVTLREPPTFRGRHTMGTPQLKESF